MRVKHLTEYHTQRLPKYLDILKSMVDINSWTDNPKGVNELARLTADIFASLGFTAAYVPSAYPGWGDHLVLQRSGTGPENVVLVSHLDTVFPPEEEARNNFHWRPEGNRIYGPGTHDIKGGTLLMWMLLDGLREFFPDTFQNTGWTLLLNSSEECFSPDFGDLCRKYINPTTRATLVFEAEGRRGEVRRIVTRRKGRSTWEILVRGRGAHAGGRHPRGANAIAELARCIHNVHQLTDYERELSFNVGRVEGGTGFNRVPHEARLLGEFRAFEADIFADGRAALLSQAGVGCIESPEDGYRCQVEARILSEIRPWPENVATQDLLKLWQEAGAEVGMELEGESRGGVSDGNHIWDCAPTLDGLGPSGDNDHCSERSPDGSKLPEYIEVTSIVPKTVVNTLAVVRLLGSKLQ